MHFARGCIYIRINMHGWDATDAMHACICITLAVGGWDRSGFPFTLAARTRGRSRIINLGARIRGRWKSRKSRKNAEESHDSRDLRICVMTRKIWLTESFNKSGKFIFAPERNKLSKKIYFMKLQYIIKKSDLNFYFYFLYKFDIYYSWLKFIIFNYSTIS